ncbi:MAG TPA: dihydroorotase family protein [Terriglobales bacterium]|nr:dihydroorotase family protein [Terriglobales bacterium]
MGTIAIENAKVILANRLAKTHILIEDEKIKSISTKKQAKADRKIDAGGKLVLPGLVDGHAHLHDPAFTNREDFTSGTKAAAAGGITTVVEMVLTTPVDSPERIQTKIDVGKRISIIDFSLHAGMMSKDNISNIPAITHLGVRSFKTFTCKPYYANDHTLMSLLRETSMNGSLLNVHAEDEEISNENFQRLQEEGRKDPMAHEEWRPNIAEERAISKLVEYTDKIGARAHVSHMSTKEGVGVIKRAKRRRVKMTAETCPHYLTFTRKEMKKQGPYLKMNPSLKGPADVEALWAGLRNGTVDIVTSEHAPGERSEKEVGWTDIWKAWGGVPTIETLLPLLLSEGVHKKRVTLATLQRVCCERPAKIFGMYPRKGVLQRGADADLVIIDLKLTRKVRAEDLHYKVGWTPYEGWTLKGWPILTMQRGRVIYESGHVIGKPGEADFLPMTL